MDLTKKVTKGRKNFYRIGNVLYIGPGITQSQRVRARSEKARAAAEKHCRAESLGPNTRDSGCSVANLFQWQGHKEGKSPPSLRPPRPGKEGPTSRDKFLLPGSFVLLGLEGSHYLA